MLRTFRGAVGRGIRAIGIRFAYTLSARNRVDGVWVGACSGRFDQRALLARATDALRLIANVDPRQYAKIQRHLKRILVMPLPGRLAQYVHTWRQCQVDDSFVMNPETTTEEIASTIVHEATHARIAQCGIDYRLQKQRHEHICLEQERGFIAHLTDGSRVLERIEHLRSKEAEFFEQSDARTRRASEAALAELGMPKWLI